MKRGPIEGTATTDGYYSTRAPRCEQLQQLDHYGSSGQPRPISSRRCPAFLLASISVRWGKYKKKKKSWHLSKVKRTYKIPWDIFRTRTSSARSSSPFVNTGLILDCFFFFFIFSVVAFHSTFFVCFTLHSGAPLSQLSRLFCRAPNGPSLSQCGQTQGSPHA